MCCWTSYLACLSPLPHLLSTSHTQEDQVDVQAYHCLNLGIVVTVWKIRYQKTRQANRDLMLYTRGLKLTDMFCLDHRGVFLTPSQNFKVE